MGEDKPILIYDGDCGFCRRVAGWVRCRMGDRLCFERAQTVVQRFPVLGEGGTMTAVLLLDEAGTLFRGVEVIYKVFSLLGGPFLLNQYQSSRSFAWLSDQGYRLVAKMRPFLSGIMDIFLGPPPEDL